MAETGTSEDDGRMSAHDLVRVARQAVEEFTGRSPEGVTGLQWDGESWLVSVDVRELERIPNTTDVMATYVVQLDDRGGLLGYRRDRRYQRGHGDEG